MKNKFVVLLAVLALVVSSLACAFGNTELGLTNLRMAFDEDGNNPTTTFSTTDVFYAVADLANAPQGTQVTALIVGSVDTRMAAHVEGAKEKPEDIARAGLRAVTRGIDELDTDRMAVEVRAALALDPKGLEKRMARMLHAPVIRTGR